MAGFIAIVWLLTREGLLVLVALAAAWRAFEKQPDRPHDWRIFGYFAAVLVAAASLTLLRSR
ncbi:MAG: hypothetical protein QOC81_956 [Thermoanaerobaculia bacterium]|jgi:hypothetical protein|nr:hypothetical protein [Thermoanaerobaculia bacterium]